MTVEVQLLADCHVFKTGDKPSLGSVMFGVTVTIALRMPRGSPVSVVRVYTYRDLNEFLSKWGHIEEFEAVALAVNGGLIENAKESADITERGVLVEDLG